MPDKISPEIRSRTMRAVKSKDSKMEVKFRSALWKLGLRFFKNANHLPGKPDIIFPRKKIAVFLDSCFWHGCPKHLRMPASNQDYWNAKIARNRERDLFINGDYSQNGWKVFRFWEHELKENFNSCLSEVQQEVNKA